MKVNINVYIYIYVKFWTLKIKCTQYGLYVAFKYICKGNVIFSKSGKAGMEHGL